MAAYLPAARVRAGPQSGGGDLVAAQAVDGQLRRCSRGRPGPHRQAQAEEDPVPAAPDRRLPDRHRPENRALVTPCTTSSTWLATLLHGKNRCPVVRGREEVPRVWPGLDPRWTSSRPRTTGQRFFP